MAITPAAIHNLEQINSKESSYNSLISTVTTAGMALLGTRASAATVMTRLWSHIYDIYI